ncbi:MAG TPA: MBL fold metallo-hydrolase [Vicinamibacterales bacterium]|jgi:glyoxylase-like metal-dependent hydrolase (beta-lactamase superfamily II)
MPLDRRQFLASSSLAAAVSALDLRTLFASAQQATQALPETAFATVRGTVGYFTGNGGTIGWHIDKKSVVVIDSQFPATAKICLDGLNERSGSRPIDFLVNTHHHGDHTAGNAVFKPVTKKILAHVNVPRLQLAAAAQAAKSAKPGAPPPPEQVVANITYENTWRENVGDEVMALKHYGPAHTSGDSVITFEKANVVHLGDLVFNRRHPYIDRPAGASIANWIKALEATVADHGQDTIYIFGHSGPKFEATGRSADLRYMRDYLTALLEFVRGEMKAGKARDAIVKVTDPLKGFPDHGPLIERVLAAAYDELSA